jgi:hypothetical protein
LPVPSGVARPVSLPKKSRYFGNASYITDSLFLGFTWMVKRVVYPCSLLRS